MRNIFIRAFHHLRFKAALDKEKRAGQHFKSRAKRIQKSYFDRTVTIKGARYLTVGYDTRVLKDSSIEIFDSYFDQQLQPAVIIGNHCWIGVRTQLIGAGKLKIGNDVFVAADVYITTLNHGMDPQNSTTYGLQPLQIQDVALGDGCWIGTKVVILPGVTIGKRSIVGAGSIVTKSIPDYSIAVGNPAKVIKKYDFEKKAWIRVI
jgi:lipopolysaccharide O-acetyltransferase